MNPLALAWREMVILAAATTGILAKEIAFEEDAEAIFPKPEAGRYLYQNLASLDEERVRSMRERNLTLLWGKIDLEAYRDVPTLPRAFLERLEAGFAAALEAGVKVIVRGSYGHRGPGGDYRTYADPEIDVMRGHLEQLAPVFARNADLIAFFEAGFLGPWGEWHTTDLANSVEGRRGFFQHLLAHTPASRMVVVRYPALKQSLFETGEPLTEETAYSGSDRARTGHHNDCFLSSPNDMGTYHREGLTMAEELAYLEKDTLYTLFGGESCALHERSAPEAALAEMERLHLSYLNSAYHPEVWERWRETGLFETIERRLGARLVLRSVGLPDKGVAGGEVAMRFEVENQGFASLYNERPVVLVLRDAEGELVQRFSLADVDPRFWQPGKCVQFAVTLTLPNELTPGVYSWALHLPDASPRLANDPRYALRLANQGIWDAETGEHRLVSEWTVER